MAHNETIWRSEVLYKGEEHSDNEHVQGSSLRFVASNSNFPYRSPGEGNGNPTPVFLLGEFHGQRSLMGYSPWDRKESHTTERLTFIC